MTDDMEPINPEIDPPLVEPVDADEPSKPSKPSWKTWVAVAGTAAVVGAAAVFGISAATSSDSTNAAASTQTDGSGTAPGQTPGAGTQPGGGFPGGMGGFGEIASIDGSKLTIKNAQSGETTKVITSSDTKVTTTVDGSLADIKVGDTVMVVGTGASPNITATRVTDDGKQSADDPAGPGGFAGNGPPGSGQIPEGRGPDGQRFNGQAPPNGQGFPGGAPPDGQTPGGTSTMTGTRGVVKSVGDGTFTVTGIDGTEVTVTTSSSTKVSVTKTGSVSDLDVGDQVMVRGETADGTITATSIREGTLGGGFFRGARPGADANGSSTNGGSQ